MRPRLHPLAWALGLYLLWTAATYLLEGRSQALLRPQATTARLLYALLANLLIGVVGSLCLLRRFASVLDPRRAGLRGALHTSATVLLALALGTAFYLLQPETPRDPVVAGNLFAQVLATSAAEVLVCWAVVGVAVERFLSQRNRLLAVFAAALASSALFGLYHFAHSPPFNTGRMVLFLAAVGLLTSAFFYGLRNLYAAIVFHNAFAVVGVATALAAAQALPLYQQWQWRYLATALAALLLIVMAHVMWLRPPAADQ